MTTARTAPSTELRFAARPDVMALHEAEALARALARYAPLDEASRALAERVAEQRAGQEFLDLFGIGDARMWDPRVGWGQLKPADRLRIPLGKDSTGHVVWLDLKEAGEGGQGPHGMLTGMTGSGKSKTQRELVLALAMLHPPEMCRLLLGDFKGEAEFAGLEALPHVVGVVSDLEGSAANLNRFEAVLRGELAMRNEKLKVAGYDSVHDYELARATTKPHLEPIGALVIVLDEFSHLLKIRPEMGKVFDEVGMQGRSKWIHILTASQRAEQTRAGWLGANCSYFMVMKVKDAGEGRAGGSARAFEEITLRKAPPGTGFLVVDGEHQKFHSYFTKAPWVPPSALRTGGVEAVRNAIAAHRFTAEVTPLPDDVVEGEDLPQDDAEQSPAGVDAPTVESVLVAQLVEHGKGSPRRVMWPPSLDELREIPVDEMAAEFWGEPWNQLALDNNLVVPYGREDNPWRHAQDLVSLDLSGAGGNVMVTGATGSGKSTTLCAMLMMLAVSHSPQRVQFFGLDFGGGKLGRLAGLSHVCAVARSGDEEKVRRVVAEVERILAFRIRNWAQEGLDVAGFRARKFGDPPVKVPDDGYGDIFVAVDGIEALKGESLDVHDRIVRLGDAGALNYGIHLVVSADSWIFANSKLEGKFGSRIELRLANHQETKCRDKQAARDVPKRPGRGLRSDGNHMLVGVPYLGRGSAEVSEQQQTERTVTAVSGLWKTRGIASAPALRMLPAQVGYSELEATERGVLKLGVGEKQMSAVGVDLSRAPHFLCVGSSGSGRTTVLRTLLQSIEESYTPEQAQVILFEPAGYDLVNAVSSQYRKVYANEAGDIGRLAEEIAKRIGQRSPPKGMDPEELAQWKPSGPKWFVVVDDLNLLSPEGAGPSFSVLLPLSDAVKKGQQLGLHVLAAASVERWHVGGNNKVIAAMSTAGAGVLIMDGPRGEIIVDGIRPGWRVPGRGELYYRKIGGELVQVALPDRISAPVTPVSGIGHAPG